MAIFVIPFVAINGILLGMDSIAQALVGALFGVFFHFYSTRLPQLVVGIDMIVTVSFSHFTQDHCWTFINSIGSKSLLYY